MLLLFCWFSVFLLIFYLTIYLFAIVRLHTFPQLFAEAALQCVVRRLAVAVAIAVAVPVAVAVAIVVVVVASSAFSCCVQ